MDSRSHLGLYIERIGDDPAAAEDIIEKLLFIGMQIEKECGPFETECCSVLESRVNILAVGNGTIATGYPGFARKPMCRAS